MYFILLSPLPLRGVCVELARRGTGVDFLMKKIGDGNSYTNERKAAIQVFLEKQLSNLFLSPSLGV